MAILSVMAVAAAVLHSATAQVNTMNHACTTNMVTNGWPVPRPNFFTRRLYSTNTDLLPHFLSDKAPLR